MATQRVELGRIVGAHGVRGGVRVRYFGDGPEHLMSIDRVGLARDGEDRSPREMEIRGATPARSGEVRLFLEGIEDRDAAEALRGSLVLGEVRELASLPEGEHYWYELIGCEVVAGDKPVGTVQEIWDTGAHDVLVVRGERGTCLVPTARDLLREIDLDGRRIVFEELEGLFETFE